MGTNKQFPGVYGMAAGSSLSRGDPEAYGTPPLLSQMEEWRRLAGLGAPTAPTLGGERLDEILVRQEAARAQKERDRERVRIWTGTRGGKVRELPSGPLMVPAYPNVGECVLVRMPGPGGAPTYRGIVKEASGGHVCVHIPEIERRDFIVPLNQVIREMVPATPEDRALADRAAAVSAVRNLWVQFEDLVREGVMRHHLHLPEVRVPEPQQTWAATLELAGGRLVEVPAPDPAIWELEEERRWEAEEGVRVHVAMAASRETDVAMKYARPVTDPHWGGGVCMLGHDAARCWAHDMARIVNAQGPVGLDPQVRGALLRSLRAYRRRPPVDPHADRAYPTLRAYLW
jgi:hypothetical protein